MGYIYSSIITFKEVLSKDKIAHKSSYVNHFNN